MKTKLLFFFSFLSIYSWSQMNELFTNEWHLLSVEIDNEEFLPPDNMINNTSIFTENGTSIIICNKLNLNYNSLNDYSFNLENLSSTLIECPDRPGLDEFESTFSSLFWFFDNQIFTYTITNDFEWEHSRLLIITNPAGNKALFINNLLSTNDINNYNINISPNPVEEKLNIQNSDSKNLNIKISDTSGKTILSQKMSSIHSEINFSIYPKGIYFITFESEGIIIKKEKIIKK